MLFDQKNRSATLQVSTWQVPTRIVHGPGVIERIGVESRGFGEYALIITDEYLVNQTSIVENIRSQLATSGISSEVFKEVKTHPDLSMVRRGMAAVRESRSQIVVGLGGGSSMDVAKTVAAAARNPDLISSDVWREHSGVVSPELHRTRPSLPLIQAPTIAATGSEVNAAASLVVEGTSKKKLLLSPLLYARVAVVDPMLTCSVPSQQTAEGSIETICRLLIPYLTEDEMGKAVQDRISEGLIRVILDYTPRALKDSADIDARTNLSLAVTNSMLGCALAGRNPYGHVLWYLSNALGTCGGLSKGWGMSALLTTYLRYILKHSTWRPGFGHPSRLADIGRSVLGVSKNCDGKAAEQTIRNIEDHIISWGLPNSLSEAGISSKLIPELANETLGLWGGIIYWISRETLIDFYSQAL